MATEKKITQEKATELKKELMRLPQKDNARSMRQFIEGMSAEINTALDKGYTLDEIHSLLTRNGISIKINTFKRYFRKKEGILPPKNGIKKEQTSKISNSFITPDTADDEL